jgi:hypothetical protein
MFYHRIQANALENTAHLLKRRGQAVNMNSNKLADQTAFKEQALPSFLLPQKSTLFPAEKYKRSKRNKIKPQSYVKPPSLIHRSPFTIHHSQITINPPL